MVKLYFKKLFPVICLICSCIILLHSSIIGASALNTGFSVMDISEEEQQKIKGNLQLKLITSEPTKYPVACFDVREDGMLVIGSNVGIHKQMICVYHQGEFQYGYTFTSAGAFCVEWDGDLINLCTVRSGLVISIDANGQILQMSEIEDTYTNTLYWYDVRANPKSAQGQTYAIQNDLGILNLFAINYSQLTSTDENGQTTVLYDAQTIVFVQSLLVTALTLILLVAVVIFLAREFWKCRHTFEDRY